MNLRPMSEVPEQTFVLLFITSGYTTTPLRCEVAKYDPGFRPNQPWVNYAGDSVFDAGGTAADLVGWLPVPDWSEEREKDPVMVDPTQWRCASCGYSNHQLRLHCRNCRAPAPEEV